MWQPAYRSNPGLWVVGSQPVRVVARTRRNLSQNSILLFDSCLVVFVCMCVQIIIHYSRHLVNKKNVRALYPEKTYFYKTTWCPMALAEINLFFIA